MRARTHPFAAARERGAILFVALIVLVAMSLAGIALMRSVDTNVLIAGNLAFRQGATAGGDWGIEDARTWISGNAALLNDDLSTPFYYASWQETQDLTGNNSLIANDYNWDSTNAGEQPRDLGFDAAGNRVQYLVHRLCDKAGQPNDVHCVKSSLVAGSVQAGTSKVIQGAGGGSVPGKASVLYRVTVKITGPRNTVSFVQAVMN
jgi:type IV pilus assembly protein PilX